MGPPPLPPGLPGKLVGYGGSGSTTQSLNGDAASPLHLAQTQQPRPQSVMTLGRSGSKSLMTSPGDEESSATSTSEEVSEASREMILLNNKTPADEVPVTNHKETFQKKHKRIRSIGGDATNSIDTSAHIPVHTPV